MHKVTASWNPPNGFDHVAFTLYFSQPGRSDGTEEMPLQQARLPDGTRWSPASSTAGEKSTVLTYLVPAATSSQIALIPIRISCAAAVSDG